MDARDLIRSDLMAMPPYSPGLSIQEIMKMHGLDSVIKMASNENPLGTPPLARKALEEASALAFRYPRNGNPGLIKAIASDLGLMESRIVAGCGSDELIDLLVRLTADPGKKRHILTYAGSFSVYPMAARLSGVECRTVPRDKGFKTPLDRLVEKADEDTALVFVANPDNPSGYAATAEELGVAAKLLPPTTLFVVDEAYIDFAWPMDDYTLANQLAQFPNVVLLRTFSKAYGLAGLRLGYAVTPKWLGDLIRQVRLPFTVNSMAEAAGMAALKDQDFYLATQGLVLEGREYLFKEFKRLECATFPSQANFIMFRPTKPAEGVYQDLLKRGLIVRHLKSFGLEDFMRVSIGTMDENRAFVAALEEILGAR